MEIEALRAFVVVAREGGFTAAARRTGIAQPSLSRRVQALEKEVAARLVVRSPRGTVLTRAGERFLEHAERALRAVDAGTGAVAELAERPAGLLTIGTMPTVGAYFLPEIVARFGKAHPEVRVRLREGFPVVLEDLLVRGDLDLAIFNLPIRHEALVARKLWKEDYLLVVPSDHRLAGRERVDLVEVATDPWVLIPGVPAARALEIACEERGVRPRVAVEVDTLEGVRRLVERGLGIALLPRLLLSAAPRRGLVAIEVGRGGPKRQVALVHRGDGDLGAAGKVFRDLLIERVQRAKKLT
jgi:DNA-binding transcriptional LysR family regulator